MSRSAQTDHHAEISANPRSGRDQPIPRSASRPSTQAHAEQTQAISFFLAMENRGRAQRREGKKMEEREKKSGKMKERERERKKRLVKNNKITG